MTTFPPSSTALCPPLAYPVIIWVCRTPTSISNGKKADTTRASSQPYTNPMIKAVTRVDEALVTVHKAEPVA